MKYIKQLDSLRAIAVIMVIISHWIGNYRLQLGQIGVDIFFVISGFLISKILLDQKNNAELLNISKSSLLKNFYIRRTLRIFPIYYLLIFIMLFFYKSIGTTIQTAYPYFLTYTANFYLFKIQYWDGCLSHLWSLAVEEQFYLVWPWIILFVNKKYLLTVIIVFILIGSVSQYLLVDVNMASILTFTCFDAFGFGAILSWLITYKYETLEKFYKTISYISVFFAFLFILGIFQQKYPFIPARTLASFIALWLITHIVINRESNSFMFKTILNNKRLIFLGKMSYGIYLYHLIIPILNDKTINIYLNPLLPDVLYITYSKILLLLENTFLVYIISWISYTFIEKQFLSLKDRFNYQNQYIQNSNSISETNTKT